MQIHQPLPFQSSSDSHSSLRSPSGNEHSASGRTLSALQGVHHPITSKAPHLLCFEKSVKQGLKADAGCFFMSLSFFFVLLLLQSGHSRVAHPSWHTVSPLFFAFFLSMKRMKPYLLISNDDGYAAKGINELIEALRPHADLLVVAPDGPRSGMGCAITPTVPLTCKLLRDEPGLKVYACSGTPVDCVKVAVNELIERQPDLVIGGINHGDNSSVNSHYSGTMGVATEGALQGFPAIAFSLCDHSPKANFEPLRPYLVDLVFKAIAVGLPPFTCLNVNFPKCDKFKGVRVCRMARSRWCNETDKREHPYAGTYYWLVGDCKELEPQATDTDRWALAHGYVAITPTQLDVTAYELMNVLSDVM